MSWLLSQAILWRRWLCYASNIYKELTEIGFSYYKGKVSFKHSAVYVMLTKSRPLLAMILETLRKI
jgi:hypothetical protein